MKRALLSSFLAAFAAHAFVSGPGIVTVAAQAQPSDGPLTFFKNYFVTGDYAVAGVGLRGTGVNGMATGLLQFQSTGGGRVVPQNADIMAAFLYWETVETPNSGTGAAGAKFRGNDISGIAFVVNPAGTAPCWSSGGATGGSNGAHKMFLRRADVARFLPIGANGKTTVNKVDLDPLGLTLDVTLPDAGRGNKVPSTSGASLVVVYRLPYQKAGETGPIVATPYKSVVIYNGGFTLDHSNTAMAQKLRGFYQAAGTSARLTHIVADGQSNFSERLLFDNAVIATNPFVGASGPAGDPAWDTRTFDVTLAPQTDANGVQFASTTVDSVGLSSSDCLSWGAVVFSTEVKDTDADGLLDIWEQDRPSPLVDPTGQPLPNLYAMGARPDVKDVFYEIGYMATSGYTNDAQSVPSHTHKPSKAVLDAVGNAYKNAPVTNPNSTVTGIRAHFDMGADPAYQTSPADPFIIPAALARGGESIGETIGCTVDAQGKTSCAGQFPLYPGTVGWKTGYRFLRDEPIADPNEPGRLRFDANRLPMFHYVLFAHSLGLPRCFGQTAPDGTDLCVEGNAGFHVPSKTSGIADPPGGDILITLGRWDNFTGTEYVQEASFLHEAGHNSGLRHFGVPTFNADGTLAFQANCKPNYLSVMNYLFQVQGLLCFAGSTSPQCTGKAPGTPVIDYSRQQLPSLDERATGSGLSEPAGLGTTAYATRWYAPKLSSFIDNDSLGLGTTPPTRFCDGTPVPNPLPAGWVDMVRIDGTTLGPALDWDGDGVANETVFGQDVTFSGSNALLGAGTLTGINGKPIGDDWANVDLRHVASRRNVGGLSLGVASTDLSDSDPGKGDTGKGDTGKGDTGKGDTGKGDTGKGDTGKGDTGKGDTGSFAAPSGDIEFDTASALGNAPTQLTFTNAQRSVTLNWFRPNAGTPVSYEVYRLSGTLTPASFAARLLLTTITGMNGQAPATTFVDTTVKNNRTYTYFVVAVHSGQPPIRSGPSNFVTVVH